MAGGHAAKLVLTMLVIINEILGFLVLVFLVLVLVFGLFLSSMTRRVLQVCNHPELETIISFVTIAVGSLV